jgi:hypothetical protein
VAEFARLPDALELDHLMRAVLHGHSQTAGYRAAVTHANAIEYPRQFHEHMIRPVIVAAYPRTNISNIRMNYLRDIVQSLEPIRVVRFIPNINMIGGVPKLNAVLRTTSQVIYLSPSLDGDLNIYLRYDSIAHQ